MRLLRLAPALVAAPLAAQPAPAPIQDNSFLVEEAYNQERGVVQHVVTFVRARSGGWELAFGQEWPLGSQRHQLSYSLPVQQVEGGGSGVADASVDYRLQVVGDGANPLAVAPRLSVLVPLGDADAGRGSGEWGVQGNLPASLVLAPALVAHANAGVTHLLGGDAAAEVNLGGSAIWLLHPRLNLMVEAEWVRALTGGGAESLLVAPGVRAAFDGPGGLQVVPGVAVPLGVGASRGERQLLLYLSLEHPFTREARGAARETIARGGAR